MATVTLNSNEYADNQGEASRYLSNGGHRTWFFPLLSDALVEINNRAAGVAGIALPYTFSTTTTEGASSGQLRFNAIDQSTSTRAFISDTEGGGEAVSALLDTLGTSTSTVKAVLAVRHRTDVTKWLIADVTAVVDDGTYHDVTITVVQASSTEFEDGDSILIAAFRNGDKGDTGSVSSASSFTISSSAPSITMTDTDISSVSRINADSAIGSLFVDADLTSVGSSPLIRFRIQGGLVLDLLSTGAVQIAAQIQAGGKFVWDEDPKGSSGSAQSILIANGAEASLTLTGDLTITVEAPDSGSGYSARIVIKQGGAGGFTPTISGATWRSEIPDFGSMATDEEVELLIMYSAVKGLLVYVTPNEVYT